MTTPIGEHQALALADLPATELGPVLEQAAAVRDRTYGRVLTFSPKVFLPLTNLCRNRCDYCSFRRSPGDEGAWTMTQAEVLSVLVRAQREGCVEALFCLGDKPEGAFRAYREELRARGQDSTVSYLEWASMRALEHGLLPHTNAGVLTREDMLRLKPVNASLGLMLEQVSERLCEPGMPHHRAPDKRPAVRLKMLREAGELQIAFTTGILIGIGETRRERVESLLAIAELHHAYGHIQEVIVQNFTPRPRIALEHRLAPDDFEMAHAVAMARLILPPEVSVQAPPNLNPERTELLIASGINDFGGISPVTPDYINPRHPWPHLEQLETACARAGFSLRPRLPVYPRYLEREGFVDPVVRVACERASARLETLRSVADLAHASSGERDAPSAQERA